MLHIASRYKVPYSNINAITTPAREIECPTMILAALQVRPTLLHFVGLSFRKGSLSSSDAETIAIVVLCGI